jgi:hypothetical protein
MEDAVHYLRDVPVFAKLADDKIREVAGALTLRVFAPGKTLIRKGRVGTTFFLLKSGSVGFIIGDGGEVMQPSRLRAPVRLCASAAPQLTVCGRVLCSSRSSTHTRRRASTLVRYPS